MKKIAIFLMLVSIFGSKAASVIKITDRSSVDDIRNEITRVGRMGLIQYPGHPLNYLAPDAREIVRNDSVARGRGLNDDQIEAEARQFLISLARTLALASFGLIRLEINQ